MVVHLCVKFQDSSIILTSFRQGRGLEGNFTPKNELLKSPLRLGLIIGFFKKNLKNLSKIGIHSYLPNCKNRGSFRNAFFLPVSAYYISNILVALSKTYEKIFYHKCLPYHPKDNISVA